jgi:hypothetical protein
LVRRFWIPSIEPRLSSLFAALGTRASPRAVLEAPTPPLWAYRRPRPHSVASTPADVAVGADVRRRKWDRSSSSRPRYFFSTRIASDSTNLARASGNARKHMFASRLCKRPTAISLSELGSIWYVDFHHWQRLFRPGG